MIVPGNSFDQDLQQAIKRNTLGRITIIIQDTINFQGSALIIPADRFVSMQYNEGILSVWYHADIPEKPMITEFIPWSDVRRIYFDDKGMENRTFFTTKLPFQDFDKI